jgi:hypothetical protein
MLYAYLTHDEVNQDLAERLAARAGVELEVLWCRDPAPAGQFDAVLYDLDCLPPDRRQALLTDLQAGQPIHAIAVHSYHLSIRQARALQRHGVIVTRRLQPLVFARLQAAVAGPQSNGMVKEKTTRRLRRVRRARLRKSRGGTTR